MFSWSKSLVILFLLTLFVACGDDEGSSNKPDVPSANERTLSGFVQKGPFAKGSLVSLQELDASTLLATDKQFEGKVLNDSGAYSIEFEEFESSYALIKAEGLFYNELTGTRTKSPIVLYALTDISERDTANVNLLTHLEYKRTLYLIIKDNLSFAEAKEQAEREVFAAFAVKDDFALAEDLNVSGSGSGNAALLAMSMLVLGSLEAEEQGGLVLGNSKNAESEDLALAGRISDIADDITSDGEWNDKRTAVKIADWAAGQRLDGDWSHSKKALPFEKYVDAFWWKIYGLDACDEKREDEARRIMTPHSIREGDYFVCTKGQWLPEGMLEGDKDTSDVQDTAQVADTSVVDTAGVSDTSTVDTAGVTDTTAVDTLSDFEKDIGGQRCTYFGRIVHGVVDTNNVYFCDGVKWKLFDGDESARYYKLMDNRDGRIYRYVRIDIQYWMAENLNYGDTAYSWNEAKTACPAGWHLPSKEEWDYLFRSIGSTSQSELDKRGFAARPAGLLGVSYWTSSYDKDSQGRYPYDIFFSNTGTGLSKLHDSTSRFPVRCVQDYETLSACDEENLHRVARYNNMVYYVCEEDGWHMMNYDEYNEFKWTGAVEGKTLWDGSDPRMCYVYDNGAWYERDSSNCKLGLGGCTAAYQDTILQASNGALYICDNLAWRWITHLDIDTRGWGLDFEEGTVRKADCTLDHYYVFQDGKWRYGTEMDSILVSRGGTACLHVGDTSTVAYAGKYYKCMENVDSDVPQEWIALTALYNDTHDDLAECSATGLYGGGNLHNKFDDESRVYACDDGTFRHVKRAERLLGRGCTSYNRGEKLQMNLSHFVCSDSGWVIDQEARGDGVMVDPRDGKTYRTIGIWKQTWMAENLNYTDAAELTVLRGRTWCYDDDPEKCNQYGALYGCAAALEVCPDGWRLPVKADIDSIIAFYQNIGWRRGTELRSATGWTDTDGESANGSDYSGFTLLPSGVKNGDGTYEGEGHEAWFWHNTGCEDEERRYAVYANYEGFFGYWYKDDAEAGYYVRCIKDSE
jgi:uncharacterized protein (TIGR02145 family)